MHLLHSLLLPASPLNVSVTKTHILSTTLTATVHYTQINTWETVELSQVAKANAAILHPNAKLCIIATQKPRVDIVHIESQRTLARYPIKIDTMKSEEPTTVAFSTETNSIFSVGDKGGSVHIYDTRLENHKSKIRTYRNIHEDEITHLKAFDGLLFSLSQDGRMAVMDLRTKCPVQVSDQQDYEMTGLVVIKNGKKIATSDQQGTIAIWNWNRWGDLSDRMPNLHPESADTIAKLDEDTVVTGSLDGNIRFINILPTEMTSCIPIGDGYPIQSIDIDSDIMAIGSDDGVVRVFDVSEAPTQKVTDLRGSFFDDIE